MSRARDPFICPAITIRTDIARRPSSDGMFLEPACILKNAYTGKSRPQGWNSNLPGDGTQLSYRTKGQVCALVLNPALVRQRWCALNSAPVLIDPAARRM